MTEHHTEFELILCCSRTHIDDTRKETIRSLIAEGIDWEYVARKAWRQGVFPLVYTNLHAFAPDVVQEDVLGEMQESYQIVVKRNLSMAVELLRLMRLFDEHKIDVVAHKGASLAVRAYGSLNLRMFSDIDLLIPQHQFYEIKALLCANGYRPRPSLPKQIEAANVRFQTDYNFTSQDGIFSIDLQWQIVSTYFTFPMNMQRLIARKQTVEVLKNDLPVLAIEDQLLALCVHGMKHCWERLSWVCDIAELVKRYPDLDWTYLVDQAQQLGGMRMLLIGLQLAHNSLDASVPPQITSQILADQAVVDIVTELEARLRDDGQEGVFEGARFSALHIRARERWRDKLLYVLRILFTPINTDMHTPLPERLFFLYYPLRLLRLGWVYGSRFFQQLVSKRSA